MPKKTKKVQEKPIDLNLRFEIHYADIDVEVDHEMYSDEEFEKIKNIVSICSKHICIDKTYVDLEDSPYEKVFLTEKGWKHMCKLMAKTDFGKKCTKKQNEELLENYSLMSLCYMYLVLEDYGYDCAGIYLEHKNQSKFMVQILEDNLSDNYTGKWQSWSSD